jgi:proteasome regulatory subunit
MTSKVKEDFNKMVSHYSIDIGALEEENKLLRETVTSLKQEVNKLNTPPLLVAEVKDVVEGNAIVKLNNGNEFFVTVATECNEVNPGENVLVEQKNLNVIKKVESTRKRFNVEKFVIIEKPELSWNEVGGLQQQAEEIQEVIELPLTKPELFKKVGIHPPKGVLLHGPPGTGKTLLAKAVAASTNSTFIEIVGSELVQKFIGEGAKLVKEVFELAREKAPAIIFIDEIDAIAATRVDVGTSGEREVQRTFMQLLAEIDGFKPLSNVKVIGCTNRKDILDSAVIRPGRLDRLIEVGHPSLEGVQEIFKIHTKNMRLSRKFNTSSMIKLLEGLSGAEIKAVCTEAGYFAIRKDKTMVGEEHFKQAITKVRLGKEEETTEYKHMFG